MKTRHICHCPDCGAAHPRQELPPVRCCSVCLTWIPLGSRARYCSDDCRSFAREQRIAETRPRPQKPQRV